MGMNSLPSGGFPFTVYFCPLLGPALVSATGLRVGRTSEGRAKHEQWAVKSNRGEKPRKTPDNTTINANAL